MGSCRSELSCVSELISCGHTEAFAWDYLGAAKGPELSGLEIGGRIAKFQCMAPPPPAPGLFLLSRKARPIMPRAIQKSSL